jgi:6-phosphogluconolactonase
MLSKDGVPDECNFHRIGKETTDADEEADKYGDILPEHIDILILSVEHDGHIASLFPFSAVLHDKRKNTVHVTATKLPRKRLTITPMVIQSAGTVYLMAENAEKKGGNPH